MGVGVTEAGWVAIAVAVAGLVGAVLASPLVVRAYDRRHGNAATQAVEAVKEDLTTGNNVKLGPMVYAMKQTLDFVATTVQAQGQVQHEQGIHLERGAARFDEMDGTLAGVADMVNDQRLEQEQFVAKVSPLCDWVERRQAEEAAS